MRKNNLVKRLIVGALLIVTLLGTVSVAEARQAGPEKCAFEFYQNEGTATKYTEPYNRGLLAEYGYVEGKSVGGNVGAIKLSIYHCNYNTMAPDEVMTKVESAKIGFTHLLYIYQSINDTCYTRLQAKASYTEAMISGYWMP